jgi:hypothetical protein
MRHPAPTSQRSAPSLHVSQDRPQRDVPAAHDPELLQVSSPLHQAPSLQLLPTDLFDQAVVLDDT